MPSRHATHGLVDSTGLDESTTTPVDLEAGDSYYRDAEEIPRADWPRLWLNMKAKHLPERVALEIQSSITQTSLAMTTALTVLAVFSTTAISLVLVPFDRPFARWWLFGHTLKYLAVIVGVLYLRRRRAAGTLTPQVFNAVMVPLAFAAGLFWGTLPAAVGAEHLETFYLATCVSAMYCLIGFFWTVGSWAPSITMALSVQAAIVMSYRAVGRPEWALAGLLGVAMLVTLLTVSVLASAALVRARYETVNARERKQMIRLLLSDFERGGHDWVWETDVDLTLLHVPPRMRKAAHGDSRFEAGANLADLLADSPEALAAVEVSESFETYIKTSGLNGRGEVRMWGRPNMVGDRCMGYRGVGSDVSAARRLAEADMIGERFDAMVALTGGLTHDFNNLLATVMGSVELAALSADEDQKVHLARAVDAILRTRRVTSDLAVASGIDVSAQPTIFETGSAVAEVLSDLRPLYPNVAIELGVDRKLWVMVDKSHFMRAIRNLAENGCQAADRNAGPSCGRLDLTIERTSPSDAVPMVQVCLTDNGPGVPWEARNRLFEPFFSTRKSEGGSGLGLAVANGFARQAGGRLTVDSSDDGARFCLLIPEATAGDLGPFEAVPPAATTADSGAASLVGRFVVVEDDVSVADNVSQWLSSLGAEVDTVGTVRDAVERFANQLDDVVCVLSDVVLPDGEGFDIIAEFRRRRPDLPAIYMSGFSHTLPASVDVELRCPLVVKPFSNAELLQALHRVGVTTLAPIESSIV